MHAYGSPDSEVPSKPGFELAKDFGTATASSAIVGLSNDDRLKLLKAVALRETSVQSRRHDPVALLTAAARF